MEEANHYLNRHLNYSLYQYNHYRHLHQHQLHQSYYEFSWMDRETSTTTTTTTETALNYSKIFHQELNQVPLNKTTPYSE